VFNALSYSVHSLSKIKLAFGATFVFLMMVHVSLDVAAKYFLNSPIIGTLETVSYYYMVGIVFLPFSFLELRYEHVYVDLFFNRFSRQLQVIAFVFGCLLSMLYYGVFCYQTLADAIKSTKDQETIMANFIFYVWPSRWALVIGSGFLVAASLLNLIISLKKGYVVKPGNSEEY